MNFQKIIRLLAAVTFTFVAIFASQAAWAEKQAKSKGASDKLVRHFASTAFKGLPDKIKDSEGNEITIDKSKTSQILVPDAQLREVILVATQVSSAANCKLTELASNYWVVYRRSLKASAKWTKQQRYFMATVFSVVISFASAEEAKANVGDSEIELKSFKQKTCSDEKRDALKAQIEANIKKLQNT